MHRTAALALLSLPLVAYSQTCTFTEAKLAGAWERRGVAGYFEQMEFTNEGGTNVFNSWLHERPDMLGGTWALAGCTLNIFATESKTPEFVYTLRVNGKGELLLSSRGEALARYRRLKSAP